jgi:uncharacterized protein YciI
MIAGTDLAERTLDADDIFRFLDRKVAQRFIMSPADIPRRIAEFDLTADMDGRYRVNECYCHEMAWQDALQAVGSSGEGISVAPQRSNRSCLRYLRSLRDNVRSRGAICSTHGLIRENPRMDYLLFYEVASDYLERRGAFRAEHLALAWDAQAKGHLVLAGALAHPADGAVFHFRSDSPAVAEEFAAADPYVRNGLVKRWRVREWITVVGDAAAAPVRPDALR